MDADYYFDFLGDPMKIILATLTATLAFFSTSPELAAQPLKIQPGLWEQTMTVRSQSGRVENVMGILQQQLDMLPPEQRRRMEETLAAQGVSLGDKVNTYRICISEDQADLDQVKLADENCTQEVVERSGNSLRLRFNCTGNPPASGEGEITIINSREYQGQATIQTQVGGLSEQVRIEQTGRWIASDCGNIQPAMR